MKKAGKNHSPLKMVFQFEDQFKGECNSLFQDGDGKLFIGNAEFFSTNAKDKRPVTTAEALEWYARCEAFAREATHGSMAPICELAAKELQRRNAIDPETGNVIVHLESYTYGLFAAAGLVHKCDPIEALDIFLNHSNWVPEFSNRDFTLNP